MKCDTAGCQNEAAYMFDWVASWAKTWYPKCTLCVRGFIKGAKPYGWGVKVKRIGREHTVVLQDASDNMKEVIK